MCRSKLSWARDTRAHVLRAGSFLVNSARGGVVDAALDVYRYEPEPPNCLLLQLENVLWTPHISGASQNI